MSTSIKRPKRRRDRLRVPDVPVDRATVDKWIGLLAGKRKTTGAVAAEAGVERRVVKEQMKLRRRELSAGDGEARAETERQIAADRADRARRVRWARNGGGCPSATQRKVSTMDVTLTIGNPDRLAQKLRAARLLRDGNVGEAALRDALGKLIDIVAFGGVEAELAAAAISAGTREVMERRRAEARAEPQPEPPPGVERQRAAPAGLHAVEAMFRQGQGGGGGRKG